MRLDWKGWRRQISSAGTEFCYTGVKGRNDGRQVRAYNVRRVRRRYAEKDDGPVRATNGRTMDAREDAINRCDAMLSAL